MLLIGNKMGEIQSNNNEVQKGSIDVVNPQKIDFSGVFSELSNQPPQNNNPTETTSGESGGLDRDPMPSLSGESVEGNPTPTETPGGENSVGSQASAGTSGGESSGLDRNPISASSGESVEGNPRPTETPGGESAVGNPTSSESLGGHDIENQAIQGGNEGLQNNPDIGSNPDIKNDAEFLKKEKDAVDIITGIGALKNPTIINEVIKEIPILTGSLVDQFLDAIERKLGFDDKLSFDNLEFIDSEAAKKLAGTNYFLSFENTKFLSTEKMKGNVQLVLAELMKHKTGLSLGLTNIDEGMAKILNNYQGKEFVLRLG